MPGRRRAVPVARKVNDLIDTVVPKHRQCCRRLAKALPCWVGLAVTYRRRLSIKPVLFVGYSKPLPFACAAAASAALLLWFKTFYEAVGLPKLNGVAINGDFCEPPRLLRIRAADIDPIDNVAHLAQSHRRDILPSNASQKPIQTTLLPLIGKQSFECLGRLQSGRAKPIVDA